MEEDAWALVGVAGGRKVVEVGRVLVDDGARKAAGRRGVEAKVLVLVDLATDGRSGKKVFIDAEGGGPRSVRVAPIDVGCFSDLSDGRLGVLA